MYSSLDNIDDKYLSTDDLFPHKQNIPRTHGGCNNNKKTIIKPYISDNQSLDYKVKDFDDIKKMIEMRTKIDENIQSNNEENIEHKKNTHNKKPKKHKKVIKPKKPKKAKKHKKVKKNADIHIEDIIPDKILSITDKDENVNNNTICPQPICPQPICPQPVCPQPVCLDMDEFTDRALVFGGLILGMIILMIVLQLRFIYK